MSVATSIYGALTRFGRQMTLRRKHLAAGGVLQPLDVVVYGTIKNYAPQELIGTIVQGDSEVIVTDTEIGERQWPGPPRANDYIIVDGVEKTVKAVETKYLGVDKLVYKLQVRG